MKRRFFISSLLASSMFAAPGFASSAERDARFLRSTIQTGKLYATGESSSYRNLTNLFIRATDFETLAEDESVNIDDFSFWLVSKFSRFASLAKFKIVSQSLTTSGTRIETLATKGLLSSRVVFVVKRERGSPKIASIYVDGQDVVRQQMMKFRKRAS